MSQSQKAPGPRNSPNRVLAIVVGLIIIIGIVVAVLSSTRSVVTLDPGTPQGTVQAYLKAVLEGNNENAAKFFAQDSQCKVQDLDRAYVNKTARVDLVKTETTADTAQVWVRVDMSSGGPFDSSMMEDHTFRLVRTNGIWFLTGIPWPLYDCGVITK